VQEIEQAFLRAQSVSPADPYLLQTEHRYRDELSQDARAFDAISKAHRLNPSIVPISIRLSRVYVERGDIDRAMATLRETLSKNSDRDLRFELGKVLVDNATSSTPNVEATELFEKSFEWDDDRLMPRLYLLREYWRGRKLDKFRQLQRAIRNMPAPRQLRSEPNLLIRTANGPSLFTGKISRREVDYAFITPTDGYPDVFVHRTKVSNGNFDDLTLGRVVTFQVGFSTRGATGSIENNR
jgi:cold shock CspA family protein/tetratricopeptide (TPR) repeat protein